MPRHLVSVKFKYLGKPDMETRRWSDAETYDGLSFLRLRVIDFRVFTKPTRSLPIWLCVKAVCTMAGSRMVMGSAKMLTQYSPMTACIALPQHQGDGAQIPTESLFWSKLPHLLLSSPLLIRKFRPEQPVCHNYLKTFQHFESLTCYSYSKN